MFLSGNHLAGAVDLPWVDAPTRLSTLVHRIDRTSPPEEGSGPLRILHITQSVSPTIGGPATVATHLAAAQAAMGHRVSLVACLPRRHEAAYQDAVRAIPAFERVETHLRPWGSEWTRLFGLRFKPLFEQTISQADVVHLHGVWDPMLIGAARVARRHGVPYVVRPCGMLDPWSLKQRAAKKRMALRFTHRGMLDGAAFIHALNEEESKLIAPLKINTSHVIIPNGVSLNEIDEAPNSALYDRLPALQGKRYLLFLGRLHYKKGLDVLAEAFAQVARLMPDIHLLVVGPDGGAKGEFVEQIARYNLTDRVHMAGELVGAAKFAAYKNAELFVLPSRQEGFSNAIIEALAAGVPVAISTECHMGVVDQINAGQVFPLNTQAVATALHGLLSGSAERRKHMGRAARRYVEEHLTWGRVAQQTVETYESLLLSRAVGALQPV